MSHFLCESQIFQPRRRFHFGPIFFVPILFLINFSVFFSSWFFSPFVFCSLLLVCRGQGCGQSRSRPKKVTAKPSASTLLGPHMFLVWPSRPGPHRTAPHRTPRRTPLPSKKNEKKTKPIKHLKHYFGQSRTATLCFRCLAQVELAKVEQIRMAKVEFSRFALTPCGGASHATPLVTGSPPPPLQWGVNPSLKPSMAVGPPPAVAPAPPLAAPSPQWFAPRAIGGGSSPPPEWPRLASRSPFSWFAAPPPLDAFRPHSPLQKVVVHAPISVVNVFFLILRFQCRLPNGLLFVTL